MPDWLAHPTPYSLLPTSCTLLLTPYSLPCTLHPTPCTLHPTPYTLHPTPYTLYPTPYTLHPTPYMLPPTPYTLHPTPYTLHPTLHRHFIPRHLFSRSTHAAIVDSGATTPSCRRERELSTRNLRNGIHTTPLYCRKKSRAMRGRPRWGHGFTTQYKTQPICGRSRSARERDCASVAWHPCARFIHGLGEKRRRRRAHRRRVPARGESPHPACIVQNYRGISLPGVIHLTRGSFT